jgi:hypothetical protein
MLGLSFILQYRFTLEVPGDQFLPVRVRVGRPSNGRYLHPVLLGLIGWPI